jgi:K+-transporting ATPase ATPase C chain
VTTSGSGLDPHITLRNAQYQSRRVVEARTKAITDEPTKKAVRDEVERVLREHAGVPLGGLIGGEKLVNVLEVNLALDEAMKKLAAR